MTLEEIKRNAPDGATHYGIEHDEDGDNVVYIYARSWGYYYFGSNTMIDEYEEYLLGIKPL